jgi:hypothetical protein
MSSFGNWLSTSGGACMITSWKG